MGVDATGPGAPRLRPGLLTAWRGPGRWQVGLGEGALVLEGLSAAQERLLDVIDGTRDRRRLVALAGGPGAGEACVDDLLAALAAAGALAGPAGAGRPARRRAATVAVDGASASALAAARALLAGGVGTLTVLDGALVTSADVVPGGLSAAAVGTARGPSAAAVLAAEHPRARVLSAGGDLAGAAPLPDAVVVVGAGALDPRRVEALVREGVTHLPVVWRGARAQLGPLVRPGETTCLRCVESARSDADPEWPRLLAQLAGRPSGTHQRPEEPALAALVGALAAAQVLAELDGGEPAALGAVLEVSLVTGAPVTTRWEPHPRCGCTWAGSGWSS